MKKNFAYFLVALSIVLCVPAANVLLQDIGYSTVGLKLTLANSTLFLDIVAKGIGAFLPSIGLYFWGRKLLRSSDSTNQILDEGLTPLMLAAAEGEHRTVVALLETGVDPDEQSKIGSTALMYAARNGHLEVVACLIGASAKLDLQSNSKSTALSIAKKFKRDDVAELLRKHGAHS